MINLNSWDNFVQKYKETDILVKKLPEFFNYYDYSKDFKNVYEPAEDTFLLVDVLNLEKPELDKKKIENSIELGCGSGFVSCSFLKLLDNKVTHYCVDINESALSLTQGLLESCNLSAKVMRSDLFENLKSLKFDIIIFNPVSYSI
jgi:release factor glutamine methyltransferase